MDGKPIEAVKNGVKHLLEELKGSSQALETAYLSVITFDSTAQQIVPLTELMQFNEPTLRASGLTSLGEALNVLKECVQREVHPNTGEQKGDWKPLVFILTDGLPTDESVFYQELQDMSSLKSANIIGCAAGPSADPELLKKITNNVILMNNLSPGSMAQFFAWASQSIIQSSGN